MAATIELTTPVLLVLLGMTAVRPGELSIDHLLWRHFRHGSRPKPNPRDGADDRGSAALSRVRRHLSAITEDPKEPTR
jgi:hypothetical protein